MMPFLLLASLLPSTTYGYGETMCGDVLSPRTCEKGAVTASGDEFDPSLPQVAIAAPFRLRLRARWVGLKVKGGKCHKVRLTDKMNERYVGVRGFDLTPAAVALLTGKPATRTWTGLVSLCKYTSSKRSKLPKSEVYNKEDGQWLLLFAPW